MLFYCFTLPFGLRCAAAICHMCTATIRHFCRILLSAARVPDSDFYPGFQASAKTTLRLTVLRMPVYFVLPFLVLCGYNFVAGHLAARSFCLPFVPSSVLHSPTILTHALPTLPSSLLVAGRYCLGKMEPLRLLVAHPWS